MEDALATAKPQSSDHQPPLPNEGARAVTNKVDSEVHPNEIWKLIISMFLNFLNSLFMLALMLNKRSVQVAKSRPTDWISGFPITNGRLQVRIIICHMKCVHLYCGYNLLNPCPVQIIKNNDLQLVLELLELYIMVNREALMLQ